MREKSNQVSINGSIENVEVTRVKIRSLLPVTVLCDIPLQVTGQVVRTDVRVCVCVCALCMCVAWRQTAGCHTQHPMQSESPTDRQIIMHSHMPQNVRAYTHTHTLQYIRSVSIPIFCFQTQFDPQAPAIHQFIQTYSVSISVKYVSNWIHDTSSNSSALQCAPDVLDTTACWAYCWACGMKPRMLFVVKAVLFNGSLYAN